MLEVRGLHAAYGATEVLRGIDMNVAPGEIVAVLGSNGVGKTTLNKVLSGVLPQRAGDITFDGRSLANLSAPAIVEAGLIHVPEGRKVFPNLSVKENLELGSYRRGRVRRHRNQERVLEIFPRLSERISQRAGTLSGGEQQMLAIARGLMAEPRLLLLDEPSLGLSPLLVEQVFTLVRRLNDEGLSIMLVEQNVVQSLECASRAYILENGRFALCGLAAEIRDNPDLKRAYLGM
jgi:branched-chain amino acid transport system ATP-binding protein